MSWPRVVAALWRRSLAEEMQYRGNFLASVAGTVFWLAMALLTLGLFFRQTDRLGGWSFLEVVVLLGVFNALAGVIESFLRPGIGQLVEQVRDGTLDLVLVRPVETQLYVSASQINVWHLVDIVLGLGLSAWAASRLDSPPGLGQVLVFLIALASAAAVIYALWMVLMSTAFWSVGVGNIAVLFDAVWEAARYPVSAYPGALRFLFVYLIPVAWTTTVPASALTGRLGWGTATGSVVVAIAALAGSRHLWRLALSRYTSAGG